MTASSAAPPAPMRVLIPFILVTLIWSSTWIVIRDQIALVPPAWSICYRFLIAGIGMAAYAGVSDASLRLARQDLPVVLAVGIFQFVLNYAFVYVAEAHVTSGLVAVIFALLIVPNAILGRIFLGQQLSPGFLVGSMIAVAGVVLLFVQEWSSSIGRTGSVAFGVCMALLAVFAASVANVLQASERARRMSSPALLCWAMLAGSAIDAAYAFAISGAPQMEWRWGYVAGLLYLALIGSTWAFALYYNVIRAIGPARAAYSNVLVPVIAMALSTLFEGYRWSWIAASGGVLVLVGLGIALRARSPAR
jgi:drug/metabolite transporter (DMT)-like permease